MATRQSYLSRIGFVNLRGRSEPMALYWQHCTKVIYDIGLAMLERKTWYKVKPSYTKNTMMLEKKMPKETVVQQDKRSAMLYKSRIRMSNDRTRKVCNWVAMRFSLLFQVCRHLNWATTQFLNCPVGRCWPSAATSGKFRTRGWERICRVQKEPTALENRHWTRLVHGLNQAGESCRTGWQIE